LGHRRVRSRPAVEPQRQGERPAGIAARKNLQRCCGKWRRKIRGSQGMTAQDYKAPESVTRLEKRALVIGVLGVVGCIIGAIMAPVDFFPSYLMAFLAVLGLSLGSLGLLMLQHLTGGHWGIVIRRPLESATRVLWLVAAFFIPLIYGMQHLYKTHTVGGESRIGWLDAAKYPVEGGLSKMQSWRLSH